MLPRFDVDWNGHRRPVTDLIFKINDHDSVDREPVRPGEFAAANNRAAGRNEHDSGLLNPAAMNRTEQVKVGWPPRKLALSVVLSNQKLVARLVRG